MMYNKTLVYIAACVGMVFFGIAFIVLGAVLPQLTFTYSLDALASSSLVSLLPVGVLTGSVLFGAIVDRYGYKALLIVSILLTSMGIEGLAFFETLNTLRLCIFLIGLGGGLLNGSTNALASDVSNDEERGAKLSFLGVCYGIGALGIPLLLGVLSKKYEFQFILQRTGFLMLLSIIYFLSIKFPTSKIKQGFPIRQTFQLIKEPLLLLMSFFLFFQSGIEGLINNWSTSFLDVQESMAGKDVVLSLTFFVLGMTLSRLILSFLLKVVKNEYILIAGIMIAFFGIVIFKIAGDLPFASFGLFMAGFGLASGFPVFINFIGTTYKNISGTAIGFAMVIALSGNTLLNLAMGFISEKFGIVSFPIFLIVLLFSQAIILYIYIKSINRIN